jgi:hypothetical protein
MQTYPLRAGAVSGIDPFADAYLLDHYPFHWQSREGTVGERKVTRRQQI